MRKTRSTTEAFKPGHLSQGFGLAQVTPTQARKNAARGHRSAELNRQLATLTPPTLGWKSSVQPNDQHDGDVK